jgi:hypothetical protein
MQAIALAAMAAALVAMFAAARLYRSTRGAHAPAATMPAVTMADAFGLGGFQSLQAPNVDGGPLPSPIEANEIVAYYGAPASPSMGILGQHDPEQAADLLDQRAAAYRFLTRSWRVMPALHVVYGVAQPAAGDASMRYIDDRSVRGYIDLARRRGFVVVLDLQIGHSDPLTEVQRIEPYLAEPDVFVALDPEFALPASTKPGEKIGSIDATAINAVQAYLADLSASRHIPKKTLIVHQFEGYMITDARAIERRPDVDLVIDMDGYGPADVKEAKYEAYAASPYAPFPGIKVFLQHDPDPLSEAALLGLRPRPAYVVYQ